MLINLEPPYEYHLAYESKQPIGPDLVRRAIYWSLLNGPTAGVTYGGHGVWGWDDGTKPPTDHPGTGKPFAWKGAMMMPAAPMLNIRAMETRLLRLFPRRLLAAAFPGALLFDMWTSFLRVHFGRGPLGPGRRGPG